MTTTTSMITITVTEEDEEVEGAEADLIASSSAWALIRSVSFAASQDLSPKQKLSTMPDNKLIRFYFKIRNAITMMMAQNIQLLFLGAA